MVFRNIFFVSIFDFLGMAPKDDNDELKNYLYCLLPQQNKGEAVFAIITRELLVGNTINGKWFNQLEEIQMKTVQQPIQKRVIRRRREQTHHYDPRKGRFVKRKRF